MKDPYLKPVIFSGLLITALSLVFILGIFVWSIIGGYIAVRLANKITKEAISYMDGIILGTLSGIVGSTCLDLLTMISFSDPYNRKLLINTIEKNWPKEVSAPNLSESLPSLFVTTCFLIIIITVVFSVLGSCLGVLLSKKQNKNLDF